MYIILNHAARIADVTEHAQYVRRQENGVTVGCAREYADGIYSAASDSFYAIDRTGYIGDGHTLVEVDEVPPEVVAGYYFYHGGEFYTTDTEQERLSRARAQEDAPKLIDAFLEGYNGQA